MAAQSQPKESGSAYVHSVTVNNGSGLALGGSSVLPTTAGCVIVTPPTSTPNPTPVNTPSRPQLISKVLIKHLPKKQERPRIFTLRNISPDETSLSVLSEISCPLRYLVVGLILDTYKVVICDRI